MYYLQIAIGNSLNYLLIAISNSNYLLIAISNIIQYFVAAISNSKRTNCLPMVQCIPVNPERQLQLKEPGTLRQVPLFAQRFWRHSSISGTNNIPILLKLLTPLHLST